MQDSRRIVEDTISSLRKISNGRTIHECNQCLTVLSIMLERNDIDSEMLERWLLRAKKVIDQDLTLIDRHDDYELWYIDSS